MGEGTSLEEGGEEGANERLITNRAPSRTLFVL
jgi:hypothetical protein